MAFYSQATGNTFDDLLNHIKQQSREDIIKEKKRLNTFISQQENQQHLLTQAKTELQILQQESQRLNAEIDNNEQKLADEEQALQRKVGDLGELFGAVRQVSGELKAEFENSVISVQFPDRQLFLDELAQSKALPNIHKLEKLWFLMLQEIGETGATRRFNADIVHLDGTTHKQDVVRIGAFVAVSDGEFLQHATETNSLLVLSRQPPFRYASTADNIANTDDEMIKIMIDPTRGQLLNMLTMKPDLWERIQQGGIIGYIILTLGVAGLLIALYRFVDLTRVSAKMATQLQQLSKPGNDNPLGRVARVYHENKNKPLDEREVAIEEAMLKEAPAIERYTGLIKLLAAISPLLGLLGTVTGMIVTFQTITLFGTSDPKLMAGGISTALVTTVLGLSVAIPLLFAHTFISSKSKRMLEFIEHQSIGLIARDAS